ncbi:sensor histidine kinase [Rhizobium oryzicola]|uniref:histidine kinase n=1 Tax=Rhizobium oryzicola TaxID=1232668 RepID=A0ABT8SX26_9HYPH|nr:HWE histidine kinase domain-containing protein [Rhizobium oryzicola]MDO1582988.1 HWE histidine kinase domain-containing protein [Rhizobium oryzicola]
MVKFDFSRHLPARVLVLEDSALDAELICEHLNTLKPPPEVRRVATRGEYLKALDSMGFDVILSDFSLPDFDGMTALEIAHARVPETPFIFVSGVLGEEAAIESFRRGATDYVLKQRLIRLPAAVERALSEAHERRELRRAEHHRELLVRELSHRVKNTMAMVMSIVRRTAKGADDVDAYVDNLTGRLRAMADAHALLFETNWREAQLQDVIRRTVTAYIRDPARIEVEPGPAIRLTPKTALALSMVLNELLTNAVKYGALAHERGRVAIRWSRGQETPSGSDLVLYWCEIDGPSVRVPSKSGFGTILIQRTIEYELQGNVTIDYSPAGLTCRLSFPLQAADDDEGLSAADDVLMELEGLDHQNVQFVGAPGFGQKRQES